MNRTEIWSGIKRDLLGLKWIGNTARQLTPPKRAPGWQGAVSYPPSLQISIFQIHVTFNISYFPQFNLPFEKRYLFQKIPKNLHKTDKQCG